MYTARGLERFTRACCFEVVSSPAHDITMSSLRSGSIERADAVIATGEGVGGAFGGPPVIMSATGGQNGGRQWSGLSSSGGGLLSWAREESGWTLPGDTRALRAPLPPLSASPTSASFFQLAAVDDRVVVEGERTENPTARHAARDDVVADTSSSAQAAAAQTVGNASMTSSSSPNITEIVYVGSLDLWGGLSLFCDALDSLLLSEQHHQGPPVAAAAAENKTSKPDETTLEAEPGTGTGIEATRSGRLEGRKRKLPLVVTVTFFGEDGPLAGHGGGIEGNDKKGSELIAERAEHWRRAGVSVSLNPETTTTTTTMKKTDVSDSVWRAVAYVIAGGGSRLAVLPVG